MRLAEMGVTIFNADYDPTNDGYGYGYGYGKKS